MGTNDNKFKTNKIDILAITSAIVTLITGIFPGIIKTFFPQVNNELTITILSLLIVIIALVYLVIRFIRKYKLLFMRLDNNEDKLKELGDRIFKLEDSLQFTKEISISDNTGNINLTRKTIEKGKNSNKTFNNSPKSLRSFTSNTGNDFKNHLQCAENQNHSSSIKYFNTIPLFIDTIADFINKNNGKIVAGVKINFDLKLVTENIHNPKTICSFKVEDEKIILSTFKYHLSYKSDIFDKVYKKYCDYKKGNVIANLSDLRYIIKIIEFLIV